MLGEDLVSVADKIVMRTFLSYDFPQLLQRPVCARMCAHVHVGLTNSSLAMRSSPHRGFSFAIRRMNCRSSTGMDARPGRDL